MKSSNTTAAAISADSANQVIDPLVLDPIVNEDKEQVIEKKATFWLSFVSALVTVARTAFSIFGRK
jgi:hypothetical protein